MLVLGVDTSSVQGQLCLLQGSEVLSSLQWVKEGSHSELVTDKLQQALEESEKKITDIEKIYCGIGPGSFTGIRVGVSFAKSIAFAYGLPITPINSLKALALSCSEDGEIVSLVDAQKNTFFFSHFFKEKQNLQILKENEMVSVNELKNHIQKSVACCGDGFPRYKDYMDPNLNSLLSFKEENKYFDISKVIQWDMKTKEIKELSWQQLQAFYIRPSSAEEKLNQKDH